MNDPLIEAYDLIPELTKTIIAGLRNANVKESLIKGLESLLRLQHSASMAYNARTYNPGSLAKLIDECKALQIEIETLDKES